MAVRPHKFKMPDSFQNCKVWNQGNRDLRLIQDRSNTNTEFAKNDENFQLCCGAAGVSPTRRQASKYRLGYGSAFRQGQPVLKQQLQQKIADLESTITDAKAEVETHVDAEIRKLVEAIAEGVREITFNLFDEGDEAEKKAGEAVNKTVSLALSSRAFDLPHDLDFSAGFSEHLKDVYKGINQANDALPKLTKLLPAIKPASNKFWGPYATADDAISETAPALANCIGSALNKLKSFVATQVEVVKTSALETAKATIEEAYEKRVEKA